MFNKLKICFMGSPEFSIPSLKDIINAVTDDVKAIMVPNLIGNNG